MMGWVKSAVKMTEDCDQCKGLGTWAVAPKSTLNCSPFRTFHKWIEIIPICMLHDWKDKIKILTVMASFTPCQTCRVLHGQNTQVFLQTFADRILVLVTQRGKVGSLVLIPYFPYSYTLNEDVSSRLLCLMPPLLSHNRANHLIKSICFCQNPLLPSSWYLCLEALPPNISRLCIPYTYLRSPPSFGSTRHKEVWNLVNEV